MMSNFIEDQLKYHTLMKRFVTRLPSRFQWTIHNVVAHPLSELLYQLGFEDWGNRIHDETVPYHESGTGRG